MTLTRNLAAFAFCAFAAGVACGQGYPNKPVKLIVPFTAGSATDTTLSSKAFTLTSTTLERGPGGAAQRASFRSDDDNGPCAKRR